jgi:hypothetical protein
MNNGNEVSYEIVFPVAWDFINDSEHIKTQIKTINLPSFMAAWRQGTCITQYLV